MLPEKFTPNYQNNPHVDRGQSVEEEEKEVDEPCINGTRFREWAYRLTYYLGELKIGSYHFGEKSCMIFMA